MRTRIITAGVVALVLGLTACGDDDDEEPAAGDGDTTEETAAPDDAAAGGTEVTIAGNAFDPDELTVASGDTVSVTNEDGIAHTFTSEDAGFDLELAGGESGEVDVTADPGTYDFVCTIHPSMTGTITVE